MLSIRIYKASVKSALLASSLGAAVVLASSAVLPKDVYANTLQLAQATSLEPQTLSVAGRGQASAPAQAAAIVLTYISNSYPEYSEDGTLVPQTPVKPSDLQSVVDAVRAEGIASDIKVSRESYDYQYLQMVVRLENPTSDRINKIKEVAADAALADGQFTPSPSGVIYATDSCDRLEDEARRQAIVNAREQAVELADASGFELGGLLAIAGGTEFNYYGSREVGCVADLDEVLNAGSQYGFADYQQARSAEVTVDFSVYATYDVEE